MPEPQKAGKSAGFETLSEKKRITNIVMMGMGEPLTNMIISSRIIP